MRNVSARILSLSCLFLAGVPKILAAPPATSALVTRTAAGPLHVSGNQLIDAHGLPFLIRGTQTAPFHLGSAAFDARSKEDFGPHSATAFSAIRLRLNMNTVRILADISEAGEPHYFDELKSLVLSANDTDLLVILAASEPGVAMPSAKLLSFWRHCAGVFKDSPNVIFDAFDGPKPASPFLPGSGAHSKEGWDFWQHGGKLTGGSDVFGMEDLVQAIRSSGAQQPVLLASWNDSQLFEGFDASRLGKDANVLYEVAPRYEDPRTDAMRDAQYGFLAGVAPLLANDWDLHLDEPQACRAVPSDPIAASRLVLDNMAYFDAHSIHWTVSAYERGKLIEETVNLTPTKLESGFTCGEKPQIAAGMGRLVLSHMFGTDEGKLIVVNISGGVVLSRGGYGIAYGRIMAERDSKSSGAMPPYRLGGLSVSITDSQNVTRPARMNWTAAGWGSLNFIVPAASALGPGRLTIQRSDGTLDTANIYIAGTAPGLFTGMNCQGPAIGVFSQANAKGRVLASSAISSCKGATCSTVAIPMARNAITKVRLAGNGFRNARSKSQIEVTIAGTHVPVLAYRPASSAGVDELTIAIPQALSGIGETDLVCHVNGILANAVRISIAGQRRA